MSKPLTAKEFTAKWLSGKRRPKYRAIPTVYNGVRYPSKSEAARAEVLDALVRAGEVSWWIGQPVFRLGCPENVYRADFLVVGRAWSMSSPTAFQGRIPMHEVWVEDVKGMETAKFRRDKKLWARYGPCPLHIVGSKGTTIVQPEARQ